MYEHEFFISRFKEGELLDYAKSIPINKPLGKVPIDKMNSAMLRNSLDQVFRDGYNLVRGKPRGIRFYEELERLGKWVLKEYQLPEIQGEDVLIECAVHVDLPEPYLLSYLFTVDPETYKLKIKDWTEANNETFLFQEYVNELNLETKLINQYSALCGFSQSEFEQKLSSGKQDLQLGSLTDVLTYKGTPEQKMKILHAYLLDDLSNGLKENNRLILWRCLALWLGWQEFESCNSKNRALEERVNFLENTLKEKDNQIEKLTSNLDREKLSFVEANIEIGRITELYSFASGKLSQKEKELEELNKKLSQEESRTQSLEHEHRLLIETLNCDSLNSATLKVKETLRNANLLLSILPNDNNYVIVSNTTWLNSIPRWIPKECFINISECKSIKWFENNQGKTLFLHRQAFRKTSDFEEMKETALNYCMKVIEAPALEESDWVRVLVGKEVI